MSERSMSSMGVNRSFRQVSQPRTIPFASSGFLPASVLLMNKISFIRSSTCTPGDMKLTMNNR